MFMSLQRKSFVDPEDYKIFKKVFRNSFIADFLSIFMVFLIFTAPFFGFLLIQNEVSSKGKIIIEVSAIIYALFILFFMTCFKDTVVKALEVTNSKLYYLLFTKKGKCLSKKDFKTIGKKNEKLSLLLSTQQCNGYCYAICFSIMKALGKGSLKFVAVKSTNEDKIDNGGYQHTMHVLYVNNGWAFDTHSCRQWPVNKIVDIYQGIEYKDFNFDENFIWMNYEDFRERYFDDMAKWCIRNEVFQAWVSIEETT